MLSVQDGEPDHHPEEYHGRNSGNKSKLGKCETGARSNIRLLELPEETPAHKAPQRSHGQLRQRIAPANPCAAGAAAATQGKPANQRHVLPPRERSVALAAMGARFDHALARGPAAQAYIQKAAEGESEQARKDRSQNANHVVVEYIAIHLLGLLMDRVRKAEDGPLLRGVAKSDGWQVRQ